MSLPDVLLAVLSLMLLAVLSLVPWRQLLLDCRAVCRRWRSLAVHPVLWRDHRQRNDADGLLRAVLLLAPCWAASLLLDHKVLEGVGMELASTNCAFAELRVEFRTERQGRLLALAIRKQGMLGRLRTLAVSLGTHCGELGRQRVVGDILCEVVRLEHLQRLEVNWGWRTRGTRPPLPSMLQATLPARPPPASLRVIEYRSAHRGPEPHLAFLLRTHAATLTEVKLSYLQWPSGLPASLFNSMRSLRVLQIPLLQDMHRLRCPWLRSLSLYPGFGEAGVPADMEAAIQHAETYFRDATGLTELQLLLWPGDAHRAYLDRLLRAHASSGRAQLEKLVVVEDVYQTPHHFTYLPNFRRLETIKFWLEDYGGAMSAPKLFWDCLASTALPSLRLVIEAGGHTGCPHAFLHRAETQDVWRKNPQLHLVTSNSCCYEDNLCDACVEAADAECHPGLLEEGENVGICGHPPGEDSACTVVDHSDSSLDAWFRLPEEQD